MLNLFKMLEFCQTVGTDLQGYDPDAVSTSFRLIHLLTVT